MTHARHTAHGRTVVLVILTTIVILLGLRLLSEPPEDAYTQCVETVGVKGTDQEAERVCASLRKGADDGRR